MILDRLERAALYSGLGPRIAAALTYLSHTDFAKLPDGRCELDGDRLYAIVQRYRTKPAAEARWEAHRQYVDVQYVVAGVERMGWTALHEGLKVAVPYDPAKDLIFFDAAGQFFDVPAGYFAVFAPSDVHAPGLQGDGARGCHEEGKSAAERCASPRPVPVRPSGHLDEVLKVVVKCRVETP